MTMANKGADMTKLKGGKMLTPVGTARYAYIGKPDDSTYGKGNYRLTMVFPDNKDPEFVAFAKKVAALNKLHNAGTGRKSSGLPIKLVTEKMAKGKDGKSGTGDKIGLPYIEFVTAGKTKEGEAITLPVYNAAGQEENLLVYGGDTVRANVTFMGWEMPDGVGVKGYLNSVQRLKSNWTGQGAGFSDMSDEYGEDETVEEEAGDDLNDEGDAGFEDESGFDDTSDDADTDSDEGEADEADPLDSLLG
jgi:hypothetical protein